MTPNVKHLHVSCAHVEVNKLISMVEGSSNVINDRG